MLYNDKTIIQALLTCLKNNNIEAYPPATKKGKCLKEYVVVKASGSSNIPGYTSEVHYYDVLCYIPRNKYTDLELFKSKIKEIIDEELFPRLVPTGSETSDYYDEEVEAYMVSIMYKNNVRNKHLR